MNKDKVIALRDRLVNEVDDAHFNMDRWLSKVVPDETGNVGVHYYDETSIPHCKTAGCMAGQVFLGLTPEQRLAYKDQFSRSSSRGNYAPSLMAMVGAMELGVSWLEAHELFEPAGLSLINRADAIAMLNHLLEHNEINWGKVNVWVGRNRPLPVVWS